jgi:hypothetical protein
MKFSIKQRSCIDCEFQVTESYVTGATGSSRFGDHFIKNNFFLKYPRSKQLPSNDLDACRYRVGTKPLVSVGFIQTKKSAIKGAPFALSLPGPSNVSCVVCRVLDWQISRDGIL